MNAKLSYKLVRLVETLAQMFVSFHCGCREPTERRSGGDLLAVFVCFYVLVVFVFVNLPLTCFA